jgi:hypothetical protein
MISAVDSAFMSTSRNLATPVAYMSGDVNVLWQLRSSAPSDDAFHRGADISLLSQYAHEDEVLFPPCTMMVVEGIHAAAAAAADGGGDGGGARPAASAAPKSPTAPAQGGTGSVAGVPQRLADRIKNMSALAIDEADEASGKAWKRIHVRPCFV